MQMEILTSMARMARLNSSSIDEPSGVKRLSLGEAITSSPSSSSAGAGSDVGVIPGPLSHDPRDSCRESFDEVLSRVVSESLVFKVEELWLAGCVDVTVRRMICTMYS